MVEFYLAQEVKAEKRSPITTTSRAPRVPHATASVPLQQRCHTLGRTRISRPELSEMWAFRRLIRSLKTNSKKSVSRVENTFFGCVSWQGDSRQVYSMETFASLKEASVDAVGTKQVALAIKMEGVSRPDGSFWQSWKLLQFRQPSPARSPYISAANHRSS